MIGKKSEAKSRTFIALLLMSFAAIFLFNFAVAPSILTLTLADFNEGTFTNVSANLSGVVRLVRELPNNQQDESPYGGINMSGNVLLMHLNNDSAYGENPTFFYDFSSMKNNGSCSGANCPIYNSSGKYGGAYQFDGSGDVVTILDNSSLDITGNITLSAWIKNQQSWSGSWPGIVTKNSGQDRTYGLFGNNDGRITWQIWEEHNAFSNNQLNNDYNWHYLVGTYDHSYIKMYVDGVLQSNPTAYSGNIMTNNQNLLIGSWTYGNWKGLIDEVAVFNRSLSADEISKIYNLSSATHGDYQSKVYDMNGSVYWKNMSWTEGAPYGEELPSNNFDEKAANIQGGTNMTTNLLLFHFNNQTNYGESNTFVYDFSGKGNNGTNYGAVWNSSGILGGAYHFTNNYIDFSQDMAPTGKNPFSVSFWFRQDSSQPTWGHIITWGGTGGNDFIQVQLLHNYGIAIGTWNEMSGYSAGAQYTPEKWYHFVGTFNGTTFKSYLNGVLAGQGEAPNVNIVKGAQHFIGKSTYYDSRYFYGLIDEVAIWNRSLSADEIANIYKRGANKLGVQVRSCDDASCSGENWTGRYSNGELPNSGKNERTLDNDGVDMTGNMLLMHFNNDSNYGENSTLAYDFSGNGNNGTITGATLVAGKIGNALKFSGGETGTNKVTLSPNKGAITNRVTIMAWVYKTAAQTFQFIVSRRDGSTLNYMFGLTNGEEQANLYISGVNTDFSKNANTAAPLNTWTHLAVTWDGSIIQYYLNGAPDGSYNAAGTAGAVNEVFLIGMMYPSGGTWTWNGMIDEVAIWNRSLSAEEILDIYNREANNYFTNSTLINISSITNLTNRYFQYKAIFETDSNSSLLVPELFNVTFNSDDGPPIVTLYPLNNAAINTAALNCSVGSSTQLTNVVLYSNVTGTWQANQTVWLTGNVNSTIFNMNLSEGSYKWNCQANNNIGSAFALSNNTFFLDYSPKINFTSPTPGNSTRIGINNTEINISLTESYLQEFKWNWNGTNYTIYNDSLILMINFDNRSSLGENSSFVKDLSKSNNNGSCSGAACPTWNSSGKYGGAYTFDGKDDYISVSIGNVINSTFTIAYWINHRGPSNGWSRVTGWTDFKFETTVSGSNGGVGFSDGTWRSTGYETGNNIWRFLVFVKNSSAVTVYADGTQIYSIGSSVALSAGTLQIGCGGYSECTNSTIDEVRIYNRSLSAAEINQSYYSNLQKYNSTDWNFYSNHSNLPNGNYNYQAFARDLASTNQTEMRFLTVDTTTPIISFGAGTEENDTAFNNRNWIYADVSVAVASEANSTFIIYNSSWSNVTYNTTPAQRFLNWTNLGQGIYYYNFSITTTAGITGSSETRKLILDNTIPFINFTTPTDNDGIHVARSNTYINTSISDNNSASAFIDFNRSLVGYWSFNWEGVSGTTVYDNSTYLNNGTMNGATWNSSGKHGGAISFDGMNDYLEVTNSSIFNFGTSNFTIDVWAKASQARNDYRALVNKYDSSAGYIGFALQMQMNGMPTPGAMYFYTKGSTEVIYYSTKVIDDNIWHHIVAVRQDNNQVRFYIDGNLIDILSGGTIQNVNSNVKLGIGSNQIAGNRDTWNGAIDEVRIWNRVLNESEINASFNAGLYKLYNNFTSLTDGNYSYQAWIIDRAGNTNKIETRSIMIDTTAPAISNTTLKSNDTTEPDDIDKGDRVNITINVTDALTGVDMVKLQWKYYAISSYFNVTMSNNSGLGRDYYNASFIPTTEGNWTYRIWANDTLGNEIYSTATNVSANLESTWTRTPTSFGTVSGILSTTRAIGNLTINNIGDYALSFYLDHNSPYNLIFSDNSFTLASKESRRIEITTTFGPVTREYDVKITIDAIEVIADPSLTTTNFSLASYAGGPYFDVQIDNYPIMMNHSETYNLSGYVKNLGNETGTGTSLNWTLPSGFTVNSGNKTWNIGNVTAGSTSRNSLNISAPPTVSPGAYTFSLYSICDQCNDSGPCGNTSYYINDSQSKTTSLACSKLSDSVCGDGCTYETDASNYDPDCTAPAPVTIQSGGGGTTGGGGAAAITSEATFELVRGKDQGFSLVVNNPYKDATLTNLKVSVEGYLAQYITVEYPNNIAPGSSATLTIKIAAPAYFTKGIHNLTFIVNSIKEKGLIKESWSEKRYVTLAVHEISKIDSEKLLNETSSLIEEMKTANLGVKTVSKLLAQSQTALDSDDYEEIQRINDLIKQLSQSAFDASNLIKEIASKIEQSNYMGINTPETSRLLELAKVAAEREDYALAFERAKEADLTYAVETKGEYNIGYFIARNSTEVFIGTLIVLCLLFVLYLRIKLTLVNVGLKESREEEDVLLGLMKETQKETFVENKRSMEEYNESMIQYENRLSKAVQRAIELETIRANLFRFKGERKRLEQERERLLNLMRETQAKYLQGGMIESRIYQNKMHSFSSRLSEIEEKLALREAEKAIKRGKMPSAFKIFETKPKAEQVEAQKEKIKEHFEKIAKHEEEKQARKQKREAFFRKLGLKK